MKKKILAVALGVTLCIGMTGCQSVTKDFGDQQQLSLNQTRNLKRLHGKMIHYGILQDL